MGRLADLAGQQFDVAVIGGGIIGSGVARDLALRGASVALIEQKDFGSGTTSASTRLIHGGLRYLEMLDFGLVRMDLREREILLRIAPHLVKPLEFRIPFVHQSFLFRQKMRVGLALYDLLSYDKSLPNHRFLSAAEALQDEPGLVHDGLQGAGSYFDAQVASPERLCLENVIDAHAHGALVRNYCRVMHAEPGKLRVRDQESGDEAELRAKVIVLAAGAWYDFFRGQAMGQQSGRIRMTKGIHLVCGEMVRKANVLFSPVDGRLFFVIPLHGKTWIGTTDTDFQSDPGEARADEEDIEYLLRSVEPFFPNVRSLPVYATNAGVRALVRSGGSASSVSRVHKVEMLAPGVVAILGGKITGYRSIAEEASDEAARLLGIKQASETAERPLPGARGGDVQDNWYGSRAARLQSLGAAQDPLAAKVRLAMEEEYCLHLDDFLLRRQPYSFSPDMGAADAVRVLETMAALLHWSPSRKQDEWTRYETSAAWSIRGPSLRTRRDDSVAPDYSCPYEVQA